VIGAGDCRDVSVAELAARFDEVILTDVVIGPELRRLAKRSGGKVRAEVWIALRSLLWAPPRLAGAVTGPFHQKVVYPSLPRWRGCS